MWQTEVEIFTKAQNVWLKLLDFETYSDWNSSQYFSHLLVKEPIQVASCRSLATARLVEKARLVKSLPILWQYPMSVTIDQSQYRMIFLWTYPKWVRRFYQITHEFELRPGSAGKTIFVHRFWTEGILAGLFRYLTRNYQAVLQEHRLMNQELGAYLVKDVAQSS